MSISSLYNQVQLTAIKLYTENGEVPIDTVHESTLTAEKTCPNGIPNCLKHM